MEIAPEYSGILMWIHLILTDFSLMEQCSHRHIPLCRGTETSLNREYIHGEHSYGEVSNHWITNGKEMYVWYSQTGEEQYFNIEKDPDNMKNVIALHPDRAEYLRKCLIKELTGREEGYVADCKLQTGMTPKTILDFLLE